MIRKGKKECNKRCRIAEEGKWEGKARPSMTAKVTKREENKFGIQTKMYHSSYSHAVIQFIQLYEMGYFTALCMGCCRAISVDSVRGCVRPSVGLSVMLRKKRLAVTARRAETDHIPAHSWAGSRTKCTNSKQIKKIPLIFFCLVKQKRWSQSDVVFRVSLKQKTRERMSINII